ncbi:hypothetical protein [Effusibacillus pohliae]|uniref:hypothetical protein n=1 Tax=Effusibacillus pohliae TaxID=232270 RepID=UPI0012E9FB24|nr:hypothetical protein [Effusibacillus pohliae]
MHAKIGRHLHWIIAFLIVFVLLMLLVLRRVGEDGAFGRFTPWVVVFLIIYVLLMFLVIGNLLHRSGRTE